MLGKKKISIREVAKRAKVSTATVSNVMNGRRSTDDEIARRVKKAAKALGYQPTRSAANLRSGKSPVVAVIVPEIDNPFFSAIVANIEVLAGEKGYELIVSSSGEDEDTELSRLRAMLAWQPSGLIAIPAEDEFANRQLAIESGVPYVIIDRTAESLVTDTVAVDNRQAGRKAFDHLAELGCERLLVVASSFEKHNIRERCAGVREAAEERGSATIKMEFVEAGYYYANAAELLTRRLARSPRPDAILATTNALTLSTLSAAIANDLAIPDEVALLGFDDYEWMIARKTAITTISQPITLMAQAAWSQIEARMSGDDSAPVSLVLECELIPRASTLDFRSICDPTADGPATTRIRGSPDS